MILQRHIIPAEYDEVRVLAHQRGYRVRDVFVRDPEASMHVCDQTDPQSRECVRQTRDRHVRACDLELVTGVGVPVDATAGERADACRGQCLEYGAATHNHRLV